MIIFDHVSKAFRDNVEAVCDVSFEISKGETLVLLGTSGSGKTTTMKMINRLIDPTAGNIYIDGKDIMNIEPISLRRQIGYAIQHIGLFDYMTVAENIAIVPKLLKWDKKKIGERIDELLELFGFDVLEYRDRYPKKMSGGERQRIGVARAIAADPPIVLMDEPFGALDPITREQMQHEFIELETDIQKTVVFVTHDIFEAVKMGDRIALMDEGRILQIAKPAELVENPANDVVEQFLGPHRFQLSLMTRVIRDFVSLPKEGEEIDIRSVRHRLSVRNSIIEALDRFKEAKQKELPVFESKRYVGKLNKAKLYDDILEILQEKEEMV